MSESTIVLAYDELVFLYAREAVAFVTEAKLQLKVNSVNFELKDNRSLLATIFGFCSGVLAQFGQRKQGKVVGESHIGGTTAAAVAGAAIGHQAGEQSVEELVGARQLKDGTIRSYHRWESPPSWEQLREYQHLLTARCILTVEAPDWIEFLKTVELTGHSYGTCVGRGRASHSEGYFSAYFVSLAPPDASLPLKRHRFVLEKPAYKDTVLKGYQKLNSQDDTAKDE